MAQATRTDSRGADGSGHPHRPAQVTVLVGSSSESFEHAIQHAVDHALEDTGKAIDGPTGAEVENLRVRCGDEGIVSFKEDLKVAGGIEPEARPPPVRAKVYLEALPCRQPRSTIPDAGPEDRAPSGPALFFSPVHGVHVGQASPTILQRR